jgi:threonine dehydratase
VSTMLLLWERTKLAVEPSGAVAAGPALMKKMDAKGKKIGIILSGGNLDLSKLPFSS